MLSDIENNLLLSVSFPKKLLIILSWPAGRERVIRSRLKFPLSGLVLGTIRFSVGGKSK